ncbi:IclR family transcriptional regulator [Streptomyces tubbatahanensis]|uniref:IclR family transcriptional regulator n=1 Tax=Streptomyces tubbatahanensis TaxID=2923272 RepID=A0ABY3XLD5_9ACTN|nr:IclR family transcriptional regulator [Streptomyces tubbatahanensis]UNS95233.1 IclR family transcriptional regulator [Streptomyces tubbatahanensis]
MGDSSERHGPRASESPAGTQAVGRALAVLRLFIEAEGDVQITEITQRLGLTPGTAHRVVGALAAEGFLVRNPATDGYYLGSTAILLGQAAQRTLGADRAMPLLKQLNAETNESVNLVVRDGDESVVVMRVQSTLPLRFEQHPGARFPLYSTASGKAMMSRAGDTEAYVRSLPARLPAVTPHTVSSPGQLTGELERTRARGYSIDNEENVEGVRCIGAPVLDAHGHAHAAVVVQVPAVRLPDTRVEELAPRLIEVAGQVAQVVPSDRTMRSAHRRAEPGR